MIELDHLVVAARSLDEGAAWLAARLGIAPDPGGRHAGFGTHNALVRLGSDVYLEVIAADPQEPEPGRPRLFGLDEATTRALLERGPRLLHWVARTRDLPAARREMAAASDVDPAAIGLGVQMRRGDLAWILSVAADGSRPPAGLPSLIDWGSAPHPCSRLPDRGAVLERLEIAAPAPTLAALAALRRGARIAFTESASARLTAHVRTPAGVAVLE